MTKEEIISKSIKLEKIGGIIKKNGTQVLPLYHGYLDILSKNLPIKFYTKKISLSHFYTYSDSEVLMIYSANKFWNLVKL